MSDIKLFQIANNRIIELEGKSVTIEKSLQSLIEKHLEAFLGVTFLASEYSTGTKHSGRIDTLGIDENCGCYGTRAALSWRDSGAGQTAELPDYPCACDCGACRLGIAST